MNVLKHSASRVLKYIGMDVHRDSTTVVVRKAVVVRGLNPEHHPELKAILKGAALAVVQQPGPLQECYARCLAQGTKPELARLTVARKIATLVLTLWKKGERFDVRHLKPADSLSV